ncbi:hypothetical protein FRB97_005463 [Tulasnella sp. 331]|nr:hypothetical protein FRB97_005463 [Tulasnella sp. 331]
MQLISPITIFIAVAVVFNVLGKLLRKFVLVPKLTIMDDLPRLGMKRKDGKIAGRAVICGGSIAGLCVAAVCSQHFESVLVIEAEGSAEELGMDRAGGRQLRELPNGLKTAIPLRKRLTQYMAPHVFMPTIVLGLRKLFPTTLNTELAYFGFDFAPLTYSFNYGNRSSPEAFSPTDPRTPVTLPVMRESFESLLRRLVVRSCGNVEYLVGTVDGFVRRVGDDHKISGVAVKGHGLEAADFVIDATGAAQMSYHKWLGKAGFNPLPSSLFVQFDPHLNYSQAIYTLPKRVLSKLEAILPKGPLLGPIYANTPDYSTGERRILYLFLHEGSQLMLLSGGRGMIEEPIPRTISAFRDYVKSLHHSDATPGWIYQILDLLEAHEDECAPWHADVKPGKMAFVKYHEAQEGTLPSNWVAVGDSVIKLNPIYGQGCSKAMMDAVSLDASLRGVSSQNGIPRDFSRRYFAKAIARTQGMWNSNKANDYGWSITEPAKGETLANGASLREFGRYTLYAGCKSRDVHATFMRIGWGMVPKTDLFTPSILGRVAWQWLTN